MKHRKHWLLNELRRCGRCIIIVCWLVGCVMLGLWLTWLVVQDVFLVI